MSKLELIKCDACGLVQGEDGRSKNAWTEINPAALESDTMADSFANFLRLKKHYCRNCWSQIAKLIPSLTQRPCAPPKEK